MIDILTAFDRFLERRGLGFTGTVIGGAALVVMGVIDRATQDVDCLEPIIPDAVKAAAAAFRLAYRGPVAPLKEEWLNNGPAGLIQDLPPGWEKRRVPLFKGRSLKLKTLGRIDLLRAKIFAFCDRQLDYQDCLALKPTKKELRTIYPWLKKRDLNELWPEHARKSLQAIAKELGYDLELER
jgi:hypothetical protein